MSCGMNTVPMAANAALEEPITIEEFLTAVRKEKTHKSPGEDGVCHEFYRMTWDNLTIHVGCDEPQVHEWVRDGRTKKQYTTMLAQKS